MIVDSSALTAIVFEEPDYPTYVHRISEASSKRISAASLLETRIVVYRAKGAAGIAILQQFIADAGIEVIEFTGSQAQLAFEAYRRFGKGTGHPAQLNILDCCAYALAAELNEPLLFKGADFSKTDVATVR